MKKLSLFLIGLIAGIVPTAFAAATIFSDVNDTDWYYEAVTSLQEKGIVAGYDDDTYRPSNNVNRAELAVMLDRLITYIEDGDSLYSLQKIEITDSIPTDSDGFSFTSDIFVDGYFVDGDTLYVNAGYGGGCEDHEFQMMWDGNFEDSEHASLYLIHDANNDTCEAYATDNLKFNLSKVRTEYENEFGSSEGDLLLNIYTTASKTDKVRVDYSFD